MSQQQPYKKFGKYILIKKIATGGMAEIFLASMAKTAGVVSFFVIKRVLPHLTANKNFQKMFKNEGQITSNLRHSNIASIYEFGCEKNMYYITMEYISGFNLKNLLMKVKKRKMKIDTPIAINIVRCVASALQYVHSSVSHATGRSLNLIHRDVSPHNIMVGFNGDVKLIDFGVAKDSTLDLTNVGVIKGKFSYMSPEQVSGSPLDHKTDIFSVGAVLWELLTGEKLFSGNNPSDIISKIKTCQIPDIHLRKDIPRSLRKILIKCLNKNKDQRYSSAEEIEKDLSLFMNKYYGDFSTSQIQSFINKIYRKEITDERNYFVKISGELNQIHGEGSISHTGSLDFNDRPSENRTGVGFREESLSYKSQKFNKDPTSSLKDLTNLSPKAPINHSATNVVEPDLTKDKQTHHHDKSIKNAQKNKNEKFKNSSSEDLELSLATAEGVAPRSVSYFKDATETVKEIKHKSHKMFALSFLMVAALGYVCWIFVKDFMFQKYHGSTQTDQNFLLSPEENDSIEILDPVQEEGHPYEELADQDNDFENDPVGESDAGERDLASERDLSSEPDAELSPVQKSNIELDHFQIYVTTVPSGCDMYIDDQKISSKTPALVYISPSQKLVIKKQDYFDHRVQDMGPNQIIKIKMKRKN